jgi:hypothetical protein
VAIGASDQPALAGRAIHDIDLDHYTAQQALVAALQVLSIV